MACIRNVAAHCGRWSRLPSRGVVTSRLLCGESGSAINVNALRLQAELAPLEELRPLMKQADLLLHQTPFEDKSEAIRTATSLVVRAARGNTGVVSVPLDLCNHLIEFMERARVNEPNMFLATKAVYACSFVRGRVSDEAIDVFYRRFFPRTDLMNELSFAIFLDALYTFDSHGSHVCEEVQKMRRKACHLALQLPDDVRAKAWLLAARAKNQITLEPAAYGEVCGFLGSYPHSDLHPRVIEYLAVAGRLSDIECILGLVQRSFVAMLHDMNPFAVRAVLAYLASRKDSGGLSEKCLVAMCDGFKKQYAGCQFADYDARGVLQFVLSLSHAPQCAARQELAITVLSVSTGCIGNFDVNQALSMAEAVLRLDIPWKYISQLIGELADKAVANCRSLEARGVVSLVSLLVHVKKQEGAEDVYRRLFTLLSDDASGLAKVFRSATPGLQASLSIKLSRLALQHEPLVSVLKEQVLTQLRIISPQTLQIYQQTLELSVVSRLQDQSWLSQCIGKAGSVQWLPKGKRAMYVWSLAAYGKSDQSINEALERLRVTKTFFNHIPPVVSIALLELRWLMLSAGIKVNRAFDDYADKYTPCRSRLAMGVSESALAELCTLLGEDSVMLNAQHSYGFLIPCLVLVGKVDGQLRARPLSTFNGDVLNAKAVRQAGLVPCVVIPAKDSDVIDVAAPAGTELISEGGEVQPMRMLSGSYSVMLRVLKSCGYRPLAMPAAKLMAAPSDMWQEMLTTVSKQEATAAVSAHQQPQLTMKSSHDSVTRHKFPATVAPLPKIGIRQETPTAVPKQWAPAAVSPHQQPQVTIKSGSGIATPQNFPPTVAPVRQRGMWQETPTAVPRQWAPAAVSAHQQPPSAIKSGHDIATRQKVPATVAPVPKKKKVAWCTETEARKLAKNKKDRLRTIIREMDQAVRLADRTERTAVDRSDPNDPFSLIAAEPHEEIDYMLANHSKVVDSYERNERLLSEGLTIGGYAVTGLTRYTLLANPGMAKSLGDLAVAELVAGNKSNGSELTALGDSGSHAVRQLPAGVEMEASEGGQEDEDGEEEDHSVLVPWGSAEQLGVKTPQQLAAGQRKRAPYNVRLAWHTPVQPYLPRRLPSAHR